MRPVGADQLQPEVRAPACEAAETVDQHREVPAIEHRSGKEHHRLARVAGRAGRKADAVRDHPDSGSRHVEMTHDLIAREAGDRQHDASAPCRLLREPAPAQAFTPAEPFRVRGKRDVVDDDHQRAARPKRRRVARREEHVGLVGGDRRRQRTLLPPRAASAGHDGDFCVEPGRHAEPAVRRVERPAVRHARRRPLLQQPLQIPSNASRVAADLARVDADAHHRSGATDGRRSYALRSA